MLKPALDYTCWHLFYSLDVLLLPSLCHKDEDIIFQNLYCYNFKQGNES